VKYTLEQVKKISPKVLLKLIDRMKKHLKSDETMKKVFEEYGADIDFINDIPMKFGDINVSAQTNGGIVILNYKLLCDGDFFDDYSYAIHEITHVLQQCFRDSPTKGAEDGEYLDNEFEQEGFAYQAEYIADQEGEEEAENYINQVLDHHKVSDEERKDKKDILMSKV
jgi:hypothetical protein